MSKTINLEGAALQIVREMVAHQDAVDDQLKALKEQADAVTASARKKEEAQTALLKQCLGLADDDCCHVDVEYLKEHGLAFARTGCSRGGGLADALANLFGKKPERASGGLH